MSGLKSELGKDPYVVLCTVTMFTESHSETQKTNTPKTTKTQKHKKPNKTQNKENNPHEQSSNVTDTFMGESGKLTQEVPFLRGPLGF